MQGNHKKLLVLVAFVFAVSGLSVSEVAQAAAGGVHGKPASASNSGKVKAVHTNKGKGSANKGIGKTKTHNRSIPGKVSSVISTSSFTMYKGNKTYTVTNNTVTVQVGDKVIVKGAVTGTDVVAISVRDLSSVKKAEVATTTTAGN